MLCQHFALVDYTRMCILDYDVKYIYFCEHKAFENPELECKNSVENQTCFETGTTWAYQAHFWEYSENRIQVVASVLTNKSTTVI